MEKISTPISQFWSCLTSVGICDGLDKNEEKYVRFTNVIAVLTALAVFAYIPYSVYKGYYLLASLQGIDAMFVLTVLWLNHLGQHTLSRYTYLIVVNGFVYINSCFIGYDSHVQDFFYISYIVPFLLFSVRSYREIISGVLIAILFFYLHGRTYQYYTAYNLNHATQMDIYSINLWMKFVLFGIAIYILSYYNFHTESQLAASNDKLESQAQELRRSNEDLEQFAAIISHDLKAPVRNISGLLSILRRDALNKLSEEKIELIDLSKNSADRMSRQIEDLLSYSKLGRNLSAATTVDPNETIKVIQMELHGRDHQHQASVIIEQPLPLLHQIHKSMIHHVFQNLIVNGIKFNNSGSPEVRISCHSAQEGYIFHVRDNGIGIDDRFKDKLFQMFKRLHTDAEFEGTGIGLAACKKIVNYYGGEIWFESEIGAGTTFSFSLPHRSPSVLMRDMSPIPPPHGSLSMAS